MIFTSAGPELLSSSLTGTFAVSPLSSSSLNCGVSSMWFRIQIPTTPMTTDSRNGIRHAHDMIWSCVNTEVSASAVSDATSEPM